MVSKVLRPLLGLQSPAVMANHLAEILMIHHLLPVPPETVGWIRDRPMSYYFEAGWAFRFATI